MAQTKSVTVNGKATTVTIDDPARDPVHAREGQGRDQRRRVIATSGWRPQAMEDTA
jgi:hypothetical protein